MGTLLTYNFDLLVQVASELLLRGVALALASLHTLHRLLRG